MSATEITSDLSQDFGSLNNNPHNVGRVDLSDNVTWSIQGDTNQMGLFGENTDIFGEKATLKLTVKNRADAAALGEHGGKITVNKLSVESTGNAIFLSNHFSAGHEISAKEIEFKSVGNTLGVQNKLVSIKDFNSFSAHSTTGSTMKVYGDGKVSVVGADDSAVTVSADENTAIAVLGNGNVGITAGDINIATNIGIADSEYKKQGVSVYGNGVLNLTAKESLTISVTGNDAQNALWLRDNGTLNLNAKTVTINGDISATSGTFNLNGNLIFNGEEANIKTLGGNQATITLTNKDQNFHIVDNNNNALTITADSKVVSTIEGLKGIASVDGEGASNVTWFIDGGLDGDDITETGGKTTYKTSKGVKVLKTFGTSLSKVAVLGLKNDVRKRLGDIRHVDAEQGAWVRYEGGRMSASGYSNKLNTLQIGYDTKALAEGVRLGAAVSYTRNDGEMDGGAFDGDTYALSLYSTWMGNNGMYADVIGRVASVKNDVTVLSGSQAFNDDVTNTAYSITGEFGQRFDIAKTFFVEPQVEMVYTYIDSGKLKLNNGNYKYDSIDSLIGRAGMVFGWTCPNDKGHVYFRASALHEFKGDSKLTTNSGNTFKTDGQDTWAELGLGAQYNVNKNIHVWADVERTQGADINEDFRGTLGVRVSF